MPIREIGTTALLKQEVQQSSTLGLRQTLDGMSVQRIYIKRFCVQSPDGCELLDGFAEGPNPQFRTSRPAFPRHAYLVNPGGCASSHRITSHRPGTGWRTWYRHPP